MQRIVTRVLGLVLVAVVGFFAITGGSGVDAPEVSGASPLAPQGITPPPPQGWEPDLSDSVLFIDGEPVTGFDGDTVWVLNPDTPASNVGIDDQFGHSGVSPDGTAQPPTIEPASRG